MSTTTGTTRLGATPLDGDRCRFEVWAPFAGSVDVRLLGRGDGDRTAALQPLAGGLYAGIVAAAPPGTLYRYRIDGAAEHADPASLSQPEGVHGPSQVVDTDAFVWRDGGWRGLELDELVLYELHIGTFSEAGTFIAAVGDLPRLRELGITAVEPMPIAQFPGGRNWGYDGVFPFAAQDTYGGPQGFAAFVDACHATGLAVVLDVVYNHLGPEGGVHRAFGPYFTGAYRTPWGDAVNFDGPGSDHVRRYFIENALSWLERFHVDALRLDAIHGIYDRSAIPFLQELAAAVDGLAARAGRRCLVIAESALNDPRVVRTRERGGFGLHAQWSDDFHHALQAYLTGERDGFFVDYGSLADIGKAYSDGFVIDGRYSRFHDRRYGAPSSDIPSDRLVVFAQNHDQVGNRRHSARLAAQLSLEELKLLAAAVLLSPNVPLLFMGEEFGETAPFPYFISHTEPELIEAVRRGRARELAAAVGELDCPDPQSVATFEQARLDRSVLAADDLRGERARLLARYYRQLLELRRTLPALRPSRCGPTVRVEEAAQAVILHRRVAARERHDQKGDVLVILTLATTPVHLTVAEGPGPWSLLLDSAAPTWGGPAALVPGHLQAAETITVSPRSVALFRASEKTA